MNKVIQLQQKPDPLEEAVYAAPKKQWAIANVCKRTSKIEKVRQLLKRDRRGLTLFVSEGHLLAAEAALAEAENILMQGVIDDCYRYFDSVQQAFRTKS